MAVLGLCRVLDLGEVSTKGCVLPESRAAAANFY